MEGLQGRAGRGRVMAVGGLKQGWVDWLGCRRGATASALDSSLSHGTSRTLLAQRARRHLKSGRAQRGQGLVVSSCRRPALANRRAARARAIRVVNGSSLLVHARRAPRPAKKSEGNVRSPPPVYTSLKDTSDECSSACAPGGRPSSCRAARPCPSGRATSPGASCPWPRATTRAASCEGPTSRSSWGPRSTRLLGAQEEEGGGGT